MVGRLRVLIVGILFAAAAAAAEDAPDLLATLEAFDHPTLGAAVVVFQSWQGEPGLSFQLPVVLTLLSRAGVDLSQPDTVRAVSSELDTLVGRLEAELGR